MSQDAAEAEATLDPEDWSELRALGHRMLDDMIEHLAGLRSQPAWQPMPPEVRGSFSGDVPYEPEGIERAYADFKRNVLPYPNGNLHPRFWGWVQGNGTPLAMLAEMLAAGMNPHMAGFNQAPALVEHQVIGWLANLIGFPSNATGILVSGGTMANTLGLAVARHAKAGFDVRELGLHGDHPRLVFYGSAETHGWARKAAEFLGLGSSGFRRVPVDEAYRIDIAALRTAIGEDRAAGLRPICVVGTAGTVNTGATDDLEALAAICREEDLWFHVDGAFGALAALSDQLRRRVAGIAEANSIGFDLHKWMYLPFEVACLLVRDGEAHHGAFASTAPYLAETTRGVIAGGLPFADRGLDLSRSFKALKVWLSVKAHGVRAFARLIEQNVAQADYLASVIEANTELELLAPVGLNVVCFRYHPGGAVMADAALDAINEEVVLRLQETGLAVPSGTRLRGRFAIRVAIVNHRSRREDFDVLVGGVLRLGREVARDHLG